MHFQVRLPTGSRFEIERDEPPPQGGSLQQGGSSYQVTDVRLLSEGKFDGIIEAEELIGPAQIGEHGP